MSGRSSGMLGLSVALLSLTGCWSTGSKTIDVFVWDPTDMQVIPVQEAVAVGSVFEACAVTDRRHESAIPVIAPGASPGETFSSGVRAENASLTISGPAEQVARPQLVGGIDLSKLGSNSVQDCVPFRLTGPGTVELELTATVEGVSSTASRTLEVQEPTWAWTWANEGPALKGELLELRGTAKNASGEPLFASLPTWRLDQDLVQGVEWHGRDAVVRLYAGALPGDLPARAVQETPTAITFDVATQANGAVLEAVIAVGERSLRGQGRLDLTVSNPDHCVLSHQLEPPTGPAVGHQGRIDVRKRENAPEGPCAFTGTITLFERSYPVEASVELP